MERAATRWMRRRSQPARLARLEVLLFGLLLVKLALSGLWLVGGGFPERAVAAERQVAPETASSGESQLLERQREELHRREERLLQHEAEVEALASDVEARLDRLARLQEEVKEELRVLLAEKDKRKNKQIKHLVEVYSSMKADKAAGLINRLDEQVVVDIFAQMPSESAGKILSFVEPEKAARISQRLAKMR
jgi:flagellar motility protein MotE (MotC chaperone)